MTKDPWDTPPAKTPEETLAEMLGDMIAREVRVGAVTTDYYVEFTIGSFALSNDTLARMIGCDAFDKLQAEAYDLALEDLQ